MRRYNIKSELLNWKTRLYINYGKYKNKHLLNIVLRMKTDTIRILTAIKVVPM